MAVLTERRLPPFRRLPDGTYEVTMVDLFCGAGGTSTGAVKAVEEIEQEFGIKVTLRIVAVNHWDVAIETHSANHRFAQHHCNSLKAVKPRKVHKGPLDILVASPECTHHSNARGGKPMDDQSRSSGDDVVRWIKELKPRFVIIENVREYRTWGPLNDRNRPIKSRRGEYFQRFLGQIADLGYLNDDQLKCAADYGDPTTRVRLFVFCKKSLTTRPTWPAPTHAKDPSKLLVKLEKWQTARDRVIDWNDLGTSILNRKRPLSQNTLRRIEAGLKKFSGIDLGGFLVKLYGTSTAASADAPVPTVTGQGGHIGLATPFQIRTDCAGGKTAGYRSIDDPAATVVGSGGLGVVKPEAFMLGQNYTDDRPAQPRSVDEPVPTVLGKGAISKVEPFMVAHFGERPGQEPRVHSVDEPTPAVTSRGAAELALPFIVTASHGVHDPKENERRAKSAEEPLGAVTGSNDYGVAQPFITEYHNDEKGKERVKPVGEPLPTQDCANRFGLAQPFMMSAGGPEVAPRSTEDPAHTVLTRDHIAVAAPFIAGAGGPSGQGRPQSVEDPLGTVIGENHRAVIVPVTHPDKPGDDPASRTRSVDLPLQTVTTARRGEIGVATAFLVQYNGTADAQSVEKPVGTITAKPRFALLVTFTNGEKCLLDILFRMLRPRELARAQGFPDDYQFTGKTEDIVKQIGNAVPVGLAAALCKSALLQMEPLE